MNVSLNWNPCSRAQWTEPRDGPTVSTRLRDYASFEEIDVVVLVA
jgi:hypothetical protein